MEHAANAVPAIWTEVTILLAVVAMATASFRRFNWNPILGLVAAGAAIGPQGFGLIRSGDGVDVMGEVGILFLLFSVGMELTPARLRSMARWIFGLGSVHFVASTAGVLLVAHEFGADWNVAAVIGVAGAMSSTAFVLQLLAERGEREMDFGHKTLSTLLFQDMMVAPILAFLPFISGHSDQAHGGSGMQMLPAVVCMFMLFVIVRTVLESVLGVIHETARADAFPAAILFIALAMGGAAHALGLSPSLGAFLAGFAISGASWRKEVRAAIGPFETTLLSFFFIGIGLKVPLSGSPAALMAIVLVAASLVAVKTAVGMLACLANGVPLRRAARTALTLAQAGEFAFVVLSTASGSGFIPERVANLWTAAAVVSLLVTPLLISLGERLEEPRRDKVASPPATDSSCVTEIHGDPGACGMRP